MNDMIAWMLYIHIGIYVICGSIYVTAAVIIMRPSTYKYITAHIISAHASSSKK